MARWSRCRLSLNAHDGGLSDEKWFSMTVGEADLRGIHAYNGRRWICIRIVLLDKGGFALVYILLAFPVSRGV